MKKAGYINVEGGPLLLIDAEDRQNWDGIDGDSYNIACDLFDRNPGSEGLLIELGRSRGLLWETSGPGTIEVFIGESNFPILIRAWLNDAGLSNLEMALESFAANSQERDQTIGSLAIRSGVLMMLWATENASGLEMKSISNQINISGELAIENSALAIPINNGVYKFNHSMGESAYGSYRILRLMA